MPIPHEPPSSGRPFPVPGVSRRISLTITELEAIVELAAPPEALAAARAAALLRARAAMPDSLDPAHAARDWLLDRAIAELGSAEEPSTDPLDPLDGNPYDLAAGEDYDTHDTTKDDA